MDAKTCIKKLRLVASVSMATVDEAGSPQIRTIGVMHVEEEKLYFLTARGKPFYWELVNNGKVATLGLTKFKEMIRLNGIPEIIMKEKQKEWIDKIFEENPYMKNVYPGESRYILEVFCIQNGDIEYFNLGVHPIFRQSYTIGDGCVRKKGYVISEACIECGACAKNCPQGCIKAGLPYHITSENCLQCGLCSEICPVSAINCN